jgi:Glycosyltransferase family 87/Dolichyl-phosphate-mannose-protein mannosyltransferase
VSELKASRPASSWRTLEAWVGTRSSAAALFVLALAVFAVESVVLPAYPGRDMTRYLQAFVQLGYDVPIYPAVLNTRGPLAALGVGVPLEVGGWAAEVFLAVLYGLSILAWARVALSFGPRAAVLTSALLLAYPGYGILFHQLASDALFAAAFAGWALLLTRAMQRPSVKAFLLVGLGLGALVLVRPANQVLILVALLLLFLRAPWRERLSWLAAYIVPYVAVAQSWKAFAELRWGEAVTLTPSTGLVVLALILVPFLLPTPWRARVGVAVVLLVVAALAVRGLPGQSPAQYTRSVTKNESNQFLFRAFEVERIMSPQNGTASRRVARIVRRELLTREPYRSYGVDVDEFFSSGSDRVFGDMTNVVPAPDLAAATREAIREHPGTFATGIARTIWEELARRPVTAPESLTAGGNGTGPTQQTQYIVVNGRRLPRPSEGQPIPASAFGPILWTPGGEAREVWRSPTEHEYVYSNPRDERRAEKFGDAVERLATRVPTRDANNGFVRRLNQASHAFPPLLAWLVIGLIAIALRRPRGALAALAPALAGIVVIVATSLVAPSVAEYAAPVSPAFVLLAAVGLGGTPSRRVVFGVAEPWRTRFAAALPLIGAAIGVAAVVWAAKIYYDTLHAHINGAGAPHDLDVFLRGAGKIIDGASPYVFNADKTFAYPPFLGWLVAPLHPLSSSGAAIVWTLLSVVAVGLALWLLELRDWRCYALAGVFIFTRSAVDLGTVEPLLLLAVAAAWRWRDRLLQPAAAIGVAIVLKLFLWPLAVWLALTQRVRAAAAAVGFAVVLAAVSWAAIGFAGIGDYPGVLRRLANYESTSSYSVVALGVRAHLPLVAARILSVLIALALLAAAAWVARDKQRTPRDRDVATLTLCLAAALAASPIVWVHYFLLLLVPLALTRPRLSPLWFVPLAYYPLGESAWPAGDARKLGLALVVTVVILGAAVLRGAGDRMSIPAGVRRRWGQTGPTPPLRPPSWSRIRSGT